jgi:hypothetical protein
LGWQLRWQCSALRRGSLSRRVQALDFRGSADEAWQARRKRDGDDESKDESKDDSNDGGREGGREGDRDGEGSGREILIAKPKVSFNEVSCGL